MPFQTDVTPQNTIHTILGDGSWSKRGWFAAHCVYPVIDFISKKVIVMVSINRARYNNGERIFDGNYPDGDSSKSMEGEGLLRVLEYLNKTGILKHVKRFVIDKDSSATKLFKEWEGGKWTQHIEVLYDPGHIKMSLQKALQQTYGTGVRYSSFASRQAKWFMRCIKRVEEEADSVNLLVPFETEVAHNEYMKSKFETYMRKCVDHYTRPDCEADPECPCRQGLLDDRGGEDSSDEDGSVKDGSDEEQDQESAAAGSDEDEEATGGDDGADDDDADGESDREEEEEEAGESDREQEEEDAGDEDIQFLSREEEQADDPQPPLPTVVKKPWLDANFEVRRKNKKSGEIVTSYPDQAMIEGFVDSVDWIIGRSAEYIHGYHTCASEAFNCIRSRWAPKHKEFWKSYEGRASLAVLHRNMRLTDMYTQLYGYLGLKFTDKQYKSWAVEEKKVERARAKNKSPEQRVKRAKQESVRKKRRSTGKDKKKNDNRTYKQGKQKALRIPKRRKVAATTNSTEASSSTSKPKVARSTQAQMAQEFLIPGNTNVRQCTNCMKFYKTKHKCKQGGLI